MAEKNLWKLLRPWLPQGRYSRIESPDTAPGSPDVNYRIINAEGWIELKDARGKNPAVPFPNEKVGLHRTQLNWIKDQILFNGIVWVVARVGDQIFWVPGKYAASFNGATMRRLRGLSTLVINTNVSFPVRRIKELLEGAK